MNRARFVGVAAIVACGTACSLLAVATCGRAESFASLAGRIGAAWASAAIAVAGSIVLHRHRILADARGRTAFAQPGIGRTSGAATTATWLFAIAILLATAIELVAVARAGPVDPEHTQRTASGSTTGPSGGGAGDTTGATDASDGGGAPRRGGLVGPNPNGPSGGSGARPDGLGDLMSSDEVMRVIERGPDERLPEGRPLHLRGFVIDGYDASGALRETSARPRALRSDALDWIEDPYTQFDHALPRPSLAHLELRFTAPSRGLVFSPHRLVAVRADEARLDLEQLALYVDGRPGRPIEILAAPISLTREELATDFARSSRQSSDRSLSLPHRPNDRALRTALGRLEALGRDLVRDARTDLDRVLAVVRYARTSFAYELYDTSFLTPVGCLEFVERGAGSCTHFASLATVLLRQLGIPTRVAAGYVARERLDDDSGWLVRQRDGHAWIEVHFDGAGWVPFDPTPGGDTVGGAQSGWTPLDHDPADLAETRDARRTTPLARIVFDGATALKAIELPGGSAFDWVIGGGATAAIAMLGWRYWRRRRMRTRCAMDRHRTRPTVRAASGERPDASIAALFDALRTHGLRQPATRTPLEFARDAEARVPEAEGLSEVFRSLLGSACLEQELPRSTKMRIRAITQRIEARSGGGS